MRKRRATAHNVAMALGLHYTRDDTWMGAAAVVPVATRLQDHDYVVMDEPCGPIGVYVMEPYDASADEIGKLSAWCRDNNIGLSISGGAEHNAGCIRIILRRRTGGEP